MTITINISADNYNRLLRIAKLDAEEYGHTYKTDEDYIRKQISYAITSEIESGESYWGKGD